MYKHSLAVLCVATVALSGVVAPAATAAEDNGCKPGMISGDPGDTTPPPADQNPDNGSSGSSAGLGIFGALAGLGIIGAIIVFFLNNHQGANPIQQLLAGLPFGRR